MKSMELTNKLKWKNIPDRVVSFVQGESAKALWDATEGIRTGEMGYDESGREVYGSTPFLAARIDTEVRKLLPGCRVATIRDLCSQEVRALIKGRYYSDSPTLIVKNETDRDYPRNDPLINFLMQTAHEKNEKLPFIVRGFDVRPWSEDKQGYKIKIIPRDDFKIIHDKRLALSGAVKFKDVDENDIPIPSRDGDKVWYLGERGLLRVSLDSSLCLDSGNRNLDNSYRAGRVVVVSGEAAQKNLEGYLDQLAQEKAKIEIALKGKFDTARGIIAEAYERA